MELIHFKITGGPIAIKWQEFNGVMVKPSDFGWGNLPKWQLPTVSTEIKL